MFLRQLFDPDTWTYTYLLADPASGKAALIDPVRDQVPRDLNLIKELGFTLAYSLDTHVHADHVTAAGLLRKESGCKTVVSARGPESADIRLEDGDGIDLGALRIVGLCTPGHTDDSMSFLVGHHLFTGDTLLVRGCGRADFQNGSAAALYESITQKIFVLDARTQVWPGHDYRGQSASTVGEEKAHNPRLAGKTKAQFVALMADLKLAPPKYLHQAVPANRELGMGVGLAEKSAEIAECEACDSDIAGDWARIVDVREPQEFRGELGHLPGAENHPMDTFPGTAASWNKNEKILVVCRSGRRSRAVCEQLLKAGFTNVSNLRGGMMDCHERGVQVSS